MKWQRAHSYQIDLVRADSGEAEDGDEFVIPRFTSIIELSLDLCANHHAGEFGYVTIRTTQSTTVVQVLNHRISQWLDNKLAEARKSTGKAS